MAVYCAWLLVFWPGVMGNDTLAVLLESDTQGGFRSGKSVLWYYLIHTTYGATQHVEVALMVLFALCALIFARLLSWYWRHGHRRAAIAMLLLICLAPHTVYFLGTLFPDGIFAVAATGLLFELWLCARRKTVSAGSALMLALTLPLALFTRANGIAFLLPAIGCLLYLQRPGQMRLSALIIGSCVLGFGAQAIHKSSNQSAVDSLVLFETVNFLRPHAMDDLWLMYPQANDPWVLRTPRVTPLTLQTLDAHAPRDKLQAYSDPGYWDMLVFHPAGPQFSALSDAQRQVLRQEFFRHNLWRNVPEFLGSRVTVFFTAALAQGGMPALDWVAQHLAGDPIQVTVPRFSADGHRAGLAPGAPPQLPGPLAAVDTFHRHLDGSLLVAGQAQYRPCTPDGSGCADTTGRHRGVVICRRIPLPADLFHGATGAVAHAVLTTFLRMVCTKAS